MSIVFALSGTDPNEVGLANFHDAMKGSRLNEESKDGVWKKSRDTGLITFLSHLESTLNVPMSDGRNVFQQRTGLPVQSEFKGLADEDMRNKTSVNKGRLETDTSINALIEENGGKPAKFMVGDQNIYDIVAPNNSMIRSIVSGEIQRQEQEKQMAEQQQLAAQQQAGAGAGTPPEELSEVDKRLIEEYGQPESANA